jgi:quinol monooxygenase YgiN
MKRPKKVFLLLATSLLAFGGSLVAQASEISVIAIVKVKAGTEAAFKAAVEKIIAPTRAETGNRRYEFNQSLTDPTEFATSERWVSDQAAQER